MEEGLFPAYLMMIFWVLALVYTILTFLIPVFLWLISARVKKIVTLLERKVEG